MQNIVILRSSTITAGEHYKQRVKQKGRKNSKKGTKPALDVLNRAEQDYAFMKPSKRLTNSGFERSKFFNVIEGQRKPKQVQHMVLPPVRKTMKVQSIGVVKRESITSANELLRKILIFKGIGLDEVERDLKVEGKAKYLVNTTVELFGGEVELNNKPLTKLHLPLDSRTPLEGRLKIHFITVKRCEGYWQGIAGREERKFKIIFNWWDVDRVNLWLQAKNMTFAG